MSTSSTPVDVTVSPSSPLYITDTNNQFGTVTVLPGGQIFVQTTGKISIAALVKSTNNNAKALVAQQATGDINILGAPGAAGTNGGAGGNGANGGNGGNGGLINITYGSLDAGSQLIGHPIAALPGNGGTGGIGGTGGTAGTGGSSGGANGTPGNTGSNGVSGSKGSNTGQAPQINIVPGN